jgi:hypothetical protein
MEIPYMFTVWPEYFEMVTLTNLTYVLNAIAMKITMTFFIEIGKNQSGISHGCTNDPKLTKQS